MDIIVVGCGRVGSRLATMLSERGHNVTVIDCDETAFGRLGEAFNGVTVKGLGFDEEVLRLAAVETCSFFCAVTDRDNANLMAAAVAQRIFGIEHVVARLYDTARATTYDRLGLDYLCETDLVAEQFLEKIDSRGGCRVDSFGDVEILRFTVGSSWVGRSVESFTEPGVFVPVIIRRAGRTFLPTAETVLEAGDVLRVAVLASRWEGVQALMAQGGVADVRRD